jgi:hypothetical protein
MANAPLLRLTAGVPHVENGEQSIVITLWSIEAGLRSNGELMCFSRRMPCHATDELDSMICAGPGAMTDRAEAKVAIQLD